MSLIEHLNVTMILLATHAACDKTSQMVQELQAEMCLQEVSCIQNMSVKRKR